MTQTGALITADERAAVEESLREIELHAKVLMAQRDIAMSLVPFHRQAKMRRQMMAAYIRLRGCK